MIRLVTGPLGTGKSYYGVRTGTEALHRGKLLITNFAMTPGFELAMAQSGHLLKGRRRYAERGERMSRRYARVNDLDDLLSVRIDPKAEGGRYGQIRKGLDGKPMLDAAGEPIWVVREGVCVVILDEAHRWMNARSWTQEGRKEILNWFALARKRGFVVYLLTQRAENVDIQVRELFEDHIRLNNLKRSARVLGIPFIPFNVFIASWVNHHYPGEVVKYERYRLDWRRKLYDTMDTSSFDDEEEGYGRCLLLPRPKDEAHDQDRGRKAPLAAPDASGPDVRTPSPGQQGVVSDPSAPFVAAPDPSL